MDKKNSSEKEQNSGSGTTVIKRVIEDEMKQSYVDYAMSVIVGRALPDVRDGLKPVHRRVLFGMHGLGLRHDKPFKKCARIVGEVLGKFHPHSDTAVYDTLVRLAQDFSMRYLLVQGHGNFGSVDGDAPASMRYTEARLSQAAEEMLVDIDKRTVKFIPNFDDSEKEPTVLPSKLPNLLINGSSGIAVGMATNIPPHNMGEIIDGVINQIDNPEITIDELMEVVKGPDFPTGGIICGRNGIINAYSTGRGKVVVRAKTETEEVKGRQRIVVTEIPYMVNKAELISYIAGLIRDKKINGISDLRDESDREGMRMIIELKKDSNAEVVLNQLYRHSRLQTTFGINMLALVNNEPKILNLKNLIKYFIEHRKDVVRKRTLFELNKAQQRAHILEGLIIALDNIDNVIKLVRGSKSVGIARSALISNFKLSEEQANAILEMKLQKLTSLEQESIRKEHKELLKLIEELKSILQNPQKILDIIKNELLGLKEKYGDDRRSEIVDLEFTELNMEDLIEKGKMVVTITHSGYIKRIPIETYKQQRRGGKGVIATTTREEDFVRDLFIADTHSYLLFFTNKGKVHWLKVYYIPEAGRTAKGKAIVNLLNLEKDEKVNAFIPVKKFDNERFLLMGTKKGVVKKTKLMAYSNPRIGGIRAITLDGGDELINVKLTDGSKQIILATKNGAAVRFRESDVRATGRSAQGVRGIRLRDDGVVGMVVADDQKTLLTVTENGYGKRTKVGDYRLISRGGVGVRNIICSERNGGVVSINSVSDSDDVLFISQRGIVIRVPVSGISVIGRATQGVRLMRLIEGDKVVATTKIVKE
ncbi:MAG: DNA gyrase subunit A [Nanoarchaeota archaeon]|nr:DNA gyrase subunit A [Nanoarchaeota archaeon]